MRALISSLALAAAVMVSAGPVLAHPEDEYASFDRKPTTSELAREAIVKLVAQAKLPASWTKATVSALDVRTSKGMSKYIVTFDNPAIRQQAKRKLYVAMTSGGDFISASHKKI